ncbi:MAG: PQQ-binding-like beta-propeller repeat protein [Chloroflexi bacterium]|nr:PQQ-binding-like beta-propeller repeat protein [Chloroflexota bacterium]
MKRFLLVPVLALALLLTACGGGAPSVGWARPVLGGDTLYINSRGGRVYALDPASGAKKWQYPPENKTISSASSSMYAAPVVGDQYVIVASSDKKVYVLKRDGGDKYCTFETGEAIIATPAYADGVVYVGSSDAHPDLTKNFDLARIPEFFGPAPHRVYAIDLTKPVDANGNCARKWDFQTRDKVWAEPLVLGDRLYVASLDRRLYALSRSTGVLLWKFEAGGAIASSPKSSGSVIYFGSFDTKIYAVNADSGAKLWDYATANWVWADPLIMGDLLIAGSLDGNLYALDLKTGAEKWKAAIGPVRAGATGRDGVVFVGTDDGKLHALNAANGSEIWSQPANDRILASPSLTNGTVTVLNANHKLLAFDAANGAKKWEFETDK